MWPRKQLDIGWRDLAYGLSQCFACGEEASTNGIAAGWIPSDQAFVSLSVRTAWDLFLQAHCFPRGSEVIVTGVTIPDMVRIVEHHGLVPVPVCVEPRRLEPSIIEVANAISPRTRILLAAHLFGSRVDMKPLVQLAHEHGLLVVEDCAQAFADASFAGSDDADYSMFSFGPIKTATALGGAVCRVRDKRTLARMDELQRKYPEQPQRDFLRRVVKYSMYCTMSWPWVYGALAKLYRLCGVDFDRAVAESSRSFPGDSFFQKIRRQPCNAMLRLLARRIARFDSDGLRRLRQRTMRGKQLARSLPTGMVVGDENNTHTYWVMPLRVANKQEVLNALYRAGFDATARSSLKDFSESARTPLAVGRLCSWLEQTIYVPNGDALPDSEWDRLGRILQRVAMLPPARDMAEPLVETGVSVES